MLCWRWLCCVAVFAETAKHTSRPFFTTDIVLSIPNVVMHPSVEEVQGGLNKAVQRIIAVSKGVLKWHKAPAVLAESKKNKTPPVRTTPMCRRY